MKKLTNEELKTMTKAQIREWVDSIACAINRTSVMCWDHTSLFKGYNVKPEYLGYNGGRFIVEGFRFTSTARKADYIGFAEWLHWAIFGEYPTEETEDTTESQTTETTEEQTTEETTTKEEQNMKNINTMTKAEAIREIATLSSSTLARICGSTNYSIIDDCSSKLILAASSMKEDAFAKCENWIDVLHTINASTDNDIDNPYLLGNMDYQEYLTKYGHDEAVTILHNYIETITSEGIQNTKWEQDYIRGAKDMLAIA